MIAVIISPRLICACVFWPNFAQTVTESGTENCVPVAPKTLWGPSVPASLGVVAPGCEWEEMVDSVEVERKLWCD
ncbi:hypothetical protein DFH06DRAFT_1190105 [Mycena polygramma]|nr:hypothetical protein DFH06DRAFT_1190105 [Mycena polygramma]